MILVNCGNKDFRSEVSLTPSKSITNRVLIIQALSGKYIDIQNESTSDDSIALKNILINLSNYAIDAKESGTAFRFLTAFLSIQEGEYLLTGSERMKRRPVGKLVQALKSLGCEIKYTESLNYPPLKITGKKVIGGKIVVDASESSQYVSALLLIAPKFSNGLEIELVGEVMSKPYISMTISLMKYFGVEVYFENNKIVVLPGNYLARTIRIENDWSSASFWYQAAALSEGAEIHLKNLSTNSIQGDSVIMDIMKQLNIDSIVSNDDIVIKKNLLKAAPAFFEYDFSSCPDLVIPVAFTCAGLRIPSLFSGVRNLRIKESDRLIAIQAELFKAGCRVELLDNSFSIHPIQINNPISMFSSHNDHRMVMAEAMLSMVFNEVAIDEYAPVTKSYPEFWNHLKQAEFNFTVT